VDTAGNESPLDACQPHKTIHLLVTINPETGWIQLDWDNYIGFEYFTYDILSRNLTLGETDFETAHLMASSTSTWSVPTDLDLILYRVTVEKPSMCTPTGNLKAGTGPYSHSMSNMEDNRLQAGENTPDTIILTNTSINENNMYGMLIGRFNTTDADTLDTHTYSLVAGEGDDDNINFTIFGDMLLAAEVFDFELKDIYSIRVRCTNKGNLTREEVFTININDVVETGLADNLSSNQIQVYPNPFNQTTTLLFNNIEGHNYTLIIMDLSGKIVRVVNDITISKYVLERKDLKEGFYFLELRGPKIYRGKIIIE
jgi:hypothetical protein